MKFYLKKWCIFMIFFSWETLRLLWHFVLMCNLSTFLSHMHNISFFFFPISFGKFQQESYACMWGHYGSRIVGVSSFSFTTFTNCCTFLPFNNSHQLHHVCFYIIKCTRQLCMFLFDSIQCCHMHLAFGKKNWIVYIDLIKNLNIYNTYTSICISF
jgi:hypothetical protein